MDIIHKYALGQDPPTRKPLWVPGDSEPVLEQNTADEKQAEDGPPKKKQKIREEVKAGGKKKEKASNPNLTAMQAHLFHLLRPLVSQHHNVRDALARCKTGDIEAFENVLALTEAAVRHGIQQYQAEHAQAPVTPAPSNLAPESHPEAQPDLDPYESSLATVARCKRPYWVCQPYVRPLPKEALEKGSMTVSKKEKKKKQREEEAGRMTKEAGGAAQTAGLVPGGRVEGVMLNGAGDGMSNESKDGMVCG